MRPTIQTALVVYKHWEFNDSPSKTDHERTLEEVCQALKRAHLPFRKISRSNLKYRSHKRAEHLLDSHDLIITVGGDGTLLHTSHFASPRHLFFAVNSAPQTSYGAFCAANRANFEPQLSAILSGKAQLLSLHRLAVEINREPVPYFALNDILFANPVPAGTSRYLFQIGSRKEFQKSSGVWVATAVGSTAAMGSAGGKILAKESSQWQFWVREPFLQEKKLKILSGILGPKSQIEFVSQMHDAAIFLDGVSLIYRLKYQDEVTIRQARAPLRIVI